MTMHLVILQDRENALHLAAKSGHVNAINILLSKNTDLITQTDNVSEHFVHTYIRSYLQYTSYRLQLYIRTYIATVV